jgi:hypothetical protein
MLMRTFNINLNKHHFTILHNKKKYKHLSALYTFYSDVHVHMLSLLKLSLNFLKYNFLRCVLKVDTVLQALVLYGNKFHNVATRLKYENLKAFDLQNGTT